MDPNEYQRNTPNKLLSIEVDVQENMITPADRDNREEVLLQEPRSDNLVKNTENPNVDNTLQAIENPNDDNNVEDVAENPCGQSSNKNNLGDSNCNGKTSYRIPDNQIKEQLEIATEAIEENQLKNSNENVESELFNQRFCRQRVVQSSNCTEELQVRRNTLYEEVERLSNVVNEELRSNAEHVIQSLIQRNIHSPVHQVFDRIHPERELLLYELLSEYTRFRQLLARDQPFLEHMQINPFLEAERQRRLRYYSNRAAILNFALTQYRSFKTKLNSIINVYYDTSREIPLEINRLLRDIRQLTDTFQRYRRYKNEPLSLDYSSYENARKFSQNNSSAQDIFDDLRRYRTMVGERILRKHRHLQSLYFRDRPFLDNMQINSSREAERRLRYYERQGRILRGMVVRFCSINDMLNSITNNYDGGSRIPLALNRILDGLLDELAELSAENVRLVELPALV